MRCKKMIINFIAVLLLVREHTLYSPSCQVRPLLPMVETGSRFCYDSSTTYPIALS